MTAVVLLPRGILGEYVQGDFAHFPTHSVVDFVTAKGFLAGGGDFAQEESVQSRGYFVRFPTHI